MAAANRGTRGLTRRNSPTHLATVSIATVVSVLLVIYIVQDLTRQPVLVTSLASSAFLLYYQPKNDINGFKPLVFGHLISTAVGYTANLLLPEPYVSSAVALSASVIILSALRLIHPPAISTSLVFSYRPIDVSAITTFLLALGVVVALALIYVFLRHGIHLTDWGHFFHPEEDDGVPSVEGGA